MLMVSTAGTGAAMADNYKQDPLVESLMALAVSAAPLIKRARESGMFKAGSREEARRKRLSKRRSSTPEAAAPETPPSRRRRSCAEKAALQDIIVSQAMKIAALEAEIAG
jgi:hypothetical protein